MRLKDWFQAFRSPNSPLDGIAHHPDQNPRVARIASSTPELVYVYLPQSIGPIDRGDIYEEPIDEELRRMGLGEVSGGGSSLGDERADGTRPIEFCGIDVDTHNVEGAREALRAILPKLGCPAGTQLHYRLADSPLQDEYDGSAWNLCKHRSMLHPGFGV